MHLAIRALVAAVVCIPVTAAAATGSVALEDLQYEGSVIVGPDGNGWVAARFPTTAGGDDVTYYLDVWTGCGDESGFERDQTCPPPVKALAATLNGEVVFRKASLSTVERKEIALNLVGTTDNEIMVSAEGRRGAVARFAIVAIAPGVYERIAAPRRNRNAATSASRIAMAPTPDLQRQRATGLPLALDEFALGDVHPELLVETSVGRRPEDCVIRVVLLRCALNGREEPSVSSSKIPKRSTSGEVSGDADGLAHHRGL